jgi:hypothetical protein
MQSEFVVLRNKRRVNSTIRVLNEITAGKKVSGRRLTRAQDFLVGFLEEINSKRPQPDIRCEL